MTTKTPAMAPRIGIMVDIESLSLSTNCVITQVALVGFRIDDPEDFLDPPVHNFLPIDAQLQLIPSRTVSGDTLIWWMQQSGEARERFLQNGMSEFEELPSLLRHTIKGFNRMTMDGAIPYEVWARGPQFDVAAVGSLMVQCGLEVPWKYDSVRDLRTLLAVAGVDQDNVNKPTGFIKHDAYWDCRFQINCYVEAMKQLRAR